MATNNICTVGMRWINNIFDKNLFNNVIREINGEEYENEHDHLVDLVTTRYF